MSPGREGGGGEGRGGAVSVVSMNRYQKRALTILRGLMTEDDFDPVRESLRRTVCVCACACVCACVCVCVCMCANV